MLATMSTGADSSAVLESGATLASVDLPPTVLRVKRTSRGDRGQVCIVSNCDSNLDSAYSRRYRLCPEHMKAPQFLIAGELHRWCQKCGKFHLLTQFEGIKRSCRVSLERHNEKQKRLRVRKQAAAAAAAKAAPAPTHAPVPVPTPCAFFTGSDALMEFSLTRAGSDASEDTLGPAPLSLAPSTSPRAVIVVEPLPPSVMVFTLDDMSVVAENTSLDVMGAWDALCGTELELDEFLAEVLPEAEMGLDDIDLDDLEASLFGGCGAAVAPAAPAMLDWAFAQL